MLIARDIIRSRVHLLFEHVAFPVCRAFCRYSLLLNAVECRCLPFLQVMAFQAVWASEGKPLISRLKQRQLGGSAALLSNSWQIRLDMGVSGVRACRGSLGIRDFAALSVCSAAVCLQSDIRSAVLL